MGEVLSLLSPSGRGGSTQGRAGEGDPSTFAEAPPSSGTTRHRSPDGEKNMGRSTP